MAVQQAEPARQPGFDDQDAERRQDRQSPELLTPFELRPLHLPERLALDLFPGRIAQTAAELLQGLDVQGCGPALHRVDVHGE